MTEKSIKVKVWMPIVYFAEYCGQHCDHLMTDGKNGECGLFDKKLITHSNKDELGEYSAFKSCDKCLKIRKQKRQA